MKKGFYTVLFMGLGAIVGGMVAWSTELAYLSILEADSLTKGVPDALGYAYSFRDPFDYVYVVLAVLGVIVGAVQALHSWERLYGDRVVLIQRRFHTQTIILYGILAVLVCALAYTTDTFGIQSFFEKEKGASLGFVDQYQDTQPLSGVAGVALLSVSCGQIEREQEGRVLDCVRPYSALFGVFQGETILKTIESTENGMFRVTLPPGKYELRPLPVSSRQASFAPISFSLQEGEQREVEVRFRPVR